MKMERAIKKTKKSHFWSPSTKSEIALDNRQKKMPQDIKQGRMLYGGAGGYAQWQQYTNKGYKKVVLK